MFLSRNSQFISILIITITIFFSFFSIKPSFFNQSDVFSEVSIENALNHLKVITEKPHFTGSEEHNFVREYLVSEFEKLGLEVEIQEQIAISPNWNAATNTKNIVTKIKGTQNGKALLLLTHYDSRSHTSLGASDAGSGIVAILEVIRTYLSKNQKPKNDIIICLTDAEELGLLGANAFVNHHPWAKDVGLVLNFEARGSGGPSYMLIETNGGNMKLIEEFQKAKTPFTAGNSLMYSIYKMLPNDTDLTVFREDANIDGFNFAFIGDHFDYHTSLDSYERMDLSSLKHQISYLNSTLNYFANSDLSNFKASDDYVYFDFPFFGLVYYPFSWVIPILIICTLLFLFLIIIGFKKKKLTLIGITKGGGAFLISFIVAPLFTIYGWKLIVLIHPEYNNILHGFPYNGYIYIAAFASISLAICFWFYKGLFKKRTPQDLLIAPLIIWLIISALAGFYLKGAGFFIIPVITLIIILFFIVFFRRKEINTLFYTVLTIPSLLIFVPFIKMFPVGLGLKMLVIASVLVILVFGILIPVFKKYEGHIYMAKVFFCIGIIALFSASAQSIFSINWKNPNSIIYVYDTSENEAYWATYNSKTDDFTEQFLGENPILGDFDNNTTASKYNTSIKLHQKAEKKQIEKPKIIVEKDTIINNFRKINISIESMRNANIIELITNIPIQFKSFSINGESLKMKQNRKSVLNVKDGTILTFFRTSENEILNIEFEIDKFQKIDFDVLESKFDLFSNPEFDILPRSENMMPMPFVLTDATIVKTNIIF